MWGERSEITPKCGQVYRASRINDPKLGEVTTLREGRGKSDRDERDTHLGVVVFISAVLEGGHAFNIVGGGDVTQKGCVRSGRATWGAILLYDHLAFRKSSPQKGVIRGIA
jgi:hypothetical protein